MGKIFFSQKEMSDMKKALVCGAGGFIGGHLVKRLKELGYWVRGVDIKEHEFTNIREIADDFVIGDLRNPTVVQTVMKTSDSWDEGFQEVYQLAADMGGAGYIFTGENDANVMHNSATINLNVADTAIKFKNKPKIFYSSSACMYPAYNQEDPENPKCSEDSAYPAAPDSEYGWEKLFSERLYLAYNRNYGLDVRIARYHNIFGPFGSWNNGKEKAPAALCRKIAAVQDGGEIEVWGDGEQTRSFLYVDECVEATLRLMNSDFLGPVNIGSEEMVSINQFVSMISDIEGKKINVKHIDGPTGVRGRNSDNKLYEEKIGWKVSQPLRAGMTTTYKWIFSLIQK
jgi:nucleoside-diphosphate-sugar epimerase